MVDSTTNANVSITAGAPSAPATDPHAAPPASLPIDPHAHLAADSHVTVAPVPTAHPDHGVLQRPPHGHDHVPHRHPSNAALNANTIATAADAGANLLSAANGAGQGQAGSAQDGLSSFLEGLVQKIKALSGGDDDDLSNDPHGHHQHHGHHPHGHHQHHGLHHGGQAHGRFDVSDHHRGESVHPMPHGGGGPERHGPRR